MKCIICKKREVKTKEMCSSCYAKDWRKNNGEKKRAYNKMRYVRDKDKILKYVREWGKKNRDKVVKQKTKWRADHSEYDKMKTKTRKLFSHLKVKCEECPNTKDLQFHHTEPFSFDNFKILCHRCHLKVHGKIMVVRN